MHLDVGSRDQCQNILSWEHGPPLQKKKRKRKQHAKNGTKKGSNNNCVYSFGIQFQVFATNHLIFL